MNILGRKSGCRAVAHDLWDYVGERLPENALERVEKHLTGCAACKNEIEGMRRAQNLLTDCRRHVPAPRSDWHDLQNRMRAEGMISPLSGRVLVQSLEREAAERPVRRPLLALDWNRLSLAGSVAATLLLSVAVYRLTMPQTPNDGTNFRSISQSNTDKPQETQAEADSHFAIGDFRPLLIQANSSSEPQPRRTAEMPHPAVHEQQNASDENASRSPIVWDSKRDLPHSPAYFKKYVARPLPSQTGKPDSANRNSVLLPPVLSQDGKDAKTRYIMRGLTPASFLEEEGIY